MINVWKLETGTCRSKLNSDADADANAEEYAEEDADAKEDAAEDQELKTLKGKARNWWLKEKGIELMT